MEFVFVVYSIENFCQDEKHVERADALCDDDG